MAHRTLEMSTQKRKCPEAKDETAGTAMCVSGCGYFGSAATGNKCSKCYREHAADTPAGAMTSVVFAAPSTAPPHKKAKMHVPIASSDGAAAAAAVDPSSLSSLLLTVAEEQLAEAKPQTAANRCVTCRKKVGLTGFRCRCERTFCGLHRYSEKHDCGYDYKTAGRRRVDGPKDLEAEGGGAMMEGGGGATGGWNPRRREAVPETTDRSGRLLPCVMPQQNEDRGALQPAEEKRSEPFFPLINDTVGKFDQLRRSEKLESRKSSLQKFALRVFPDPGFGPFGSAPRAESADFRVGGLPNGLLTSSSYHLLYKLQRRKKPS